MSIFENPAIALTKQRHKDNEQLKRGILVNVKMMARHGIPFRKNFLVCKHFSWKQTPDSYLYFFLEIVMLENNVILDTA